MRSLGGGSIRGGSAGAADMGCSKKGAHVAPRHILTHRENSIRRKCPVNGRYLTPCVSRTTIPVSGDALHGQASQLALMTGVLHFFQYLKPTRIVRPFRIRRKLRQAEPNICPKSRISKGVRVCHGPVGGNSRHRERSTGTVDNAMNLLQLSCFLIQILHYPGRPRCRRCSRRPGSSGYGCRR